MITSKFQLEIILTIAIFMLKIPFLKHGTLFGTNQMFHIKL